MGPKTATDSDQERLTRERYTSACGVDLPAVVLVLDVGGPRIDGPEHTQGMSHCSTCRPKTSPAVYNVLPPQFERQLILDHVFGCDVALLPMAASLPPTKPPVSAMQLVSPTSAGLAASDVALFQPGTFRHPGQVVVLFHHAVTGSRGAPQKIPFASGVLSSAVASIERAIAASKKTRCSAVSRLV